ncbi:MAG: flagellar export chaperone FliS [Nitrospiraceae bacterium]|nr:flagellar export chaperone FliS [Nitrospiraceae bacterium]
MEFLHKAVFYMGRQDVAKKLHYMSKSLDIITELLNSLNMKDGGEVACNLQNLYIYMMKELTSANIRNDPEKINRVQGLLRVLRDGWKGIR